MLTLTYTKSFLAEAAVAAPTSHGREPVSDRRSGEAATLARRRVS
jgi:hypothetical protein